MFAYFHGMLKGGAAIYYDEEIEVETLETREGFTKVEITFQNEVHREKNYKFNKFFSFGFVKKIGIKNCPRYPNFRGNSYDCFVSICR